MDVGEDGRSCIEHTTSTHLTKDAEKTALRLVRFILVWYNYYTTFLKLCQAIFENYKSRGNPTAFGFFLTDFSPQILRASPAV